MATTPRATPTRTKASKPKAHFSLDAAIAERDDDEIVEPFTVQLPGDGKVVTLRNPNDVGWKAAASITPEEPFLFVTTIVEESDHDAFFEADFPVRALRKLMAAWREHYGLPSVGE